MQSKDVKYSGFQSRVVYFLCYYEPTTVVHDEQSAWLPVPFDSCNLPTTSLPIPLTYVPLYATIMIFQEVF